MGKINLPSDARLYLSPGFYDLSGADQPSDTKVQAIEGDSQFVKYPSLSWLDKMWYINNKALPD
jgi:hypothetical protein